MKTPQVISVPISKAQLPQLHKAKLSYWGVREMGEILEDKTLKFWIYPHDFFHDQPMSKGQQMTLDDLLKTLEKDKNEYHITNAESC